MAGPRVLTFNFHEPYLCLMAKTGLPITVGLYDSGDLQRPWHTHFRPVPHNIQLVPESEWRRTLHEGGFDVIVAHNEINAATVFRSATPALLVCHNRRSFIRSNFPANAPHELTAYDRLLDRLQERFGFIFISESKRDDYGIPGRVILPGIDVDEYGGYCGDVAEVLRVGNAMRERTRMFDVDLQEAVCAGFPQRVVGNNPTIEGSRAADSFEDLLWHYRHLRAYLHISREGWEDGYNLAMLEAMACGMPVVALANVFSPLTHGVDGLVADNTQGLREHVAALLGDLDAAKALGARGRDTVARLYPLERFVDAWRRVLEEAAEGRRAPTPATEPDAAPRHRVLLHFSSGPFRQGRFLEWALRRKHEVVTMGPQADAAPDGPPIGPPNHQIAIPDDDPQQELDKLQKADRAPELCVCMYEDAQDLPAFPAALDALPKAMWDISGTLGAEALRGFSTVFSSHPAHVDQLRAEGMAVEWLPQACAPEWFDFDEPAREIDVLVLGEEGPRRDAVAGAMAELGVRVRVMAPRAGAGFEKILARSAVAVIVPEGDSVGWPLVAAMMAGALVLAPPGGGLEALFRDSEHLFVWNDPAEAAARVKQCLSDADMRTRIAESGQRHVLAGHTYEHRMERLMGALAKTPVEQPNQDLRLEVGGYYRSPRPELAVHVPLRTRRLLDVGCGAGEFGRALKHERGVQEVVGIEIVEAAWRIAQQSLDRALLGNIETMDLPFPDGHFDCITCGDVLEHLVHPLEALKKLRRVLSPDGIIVASIPNARFYQVVEMLANGRWTYMDAGIMDRTHLRFFTAVEMVEMFQNSDLQVRTIAPLSMMNKEAVPFSEDGYIQLQKLRLGPLTLSEYNDFLVYQYLVIAGKYSAKLLEQAERHLEARENDHALNVARLAREKGEDEASCLRVMGKSAARLGRVNEAEAYYREALLLRPNDGELRGEYGIVLFAQGRCVDARVQLDQANAQQPHHGRILSGLGLCDLSAGNADGAFARFREALDADFDNEAAVEHLVGTAQSLGRLADAEPYVRRFVEFYPGNLDMGCVHAAVLIELGRMAEARERLDNVLLLDSGHARALGLMEKVREG